MKNYRIKNHYDKGFIVQERYYLFYWSTFTIRGDMQISFYPQIFDTKEEARDKIKELKKIKATLKKAKYIEYV